MGMLPACVCVCVSYVKYLRRPEGAIRSPGSVTGVTDSHEPLYGCWELSLDLLEEKPVLLTTEICLLLSPSNFILTPSDQWDKEAYREMG